MEQASASSLALQSCKEAATCQALTEFMRLKPCRMISELTH